MASATQHTREDAGVLLVLSAYTALAMFLAYRLPLWADEAYTLATTSGSLAKAAHQAVGFELQPPLYFMVLWLWRSLNRSLLWGRALGVLCVGTAAWLASRLSRRVAPGLSPAWTAAIFAFNPLSIWSAVELRPYPMALLLGMTLVTAFPSSLLAESSGRRTAVRYGVLSTVALYTQYYLGFLLPAQAAALAILGPRRRIRVYLAILCAVGVASLPIVPWVLDQLPAQAPFGSDGLSVGDVVALLGRGLRYIVPTPLSHQRSWLELVGIVPLALVVVASRKRTGQWSREALWFACIVLAASGCAALAALLVGPENTSERHTIAILPPSLLLLVALCRQTPLRLSRAVLAVLILLDAALLVRQYRPLSKDGDSAHVAGYLDGAARPGEPIFVFPGPNVLPLRFYQRGISPIVALPMEPSLDTFDQTRFPIPDSIALIRRFSEYPPARCALWLVVEPTGKDLGLDFGQPVLEEYVAAHYRELERREFAGNVSVRRLENRRCQNS